MLGLVSNDAPQEENIAPMVHVCLCRNCILVLHIPPFRVHRVEGLGDELTEALGMVPSSEALQNDMRLSENWGPKRV